MRIVLAPDKFRGSLTAPQVADHLATGLRAVVDEVVVDVAPVADGGEGTVDAALGAGFTRRSVAVTGPDGGIVEAAFAVNGTRAVIEMAAASGLDLVAPSERDALGATSRGTGEVIGAAIDLGCTDIILGVGGSACTDGGAGMLAALGARLIDADGAELPDGGGSLTRLGRIDLAALDPRLAAATFTLAGDVDNVLLGERGAAAVFGPQKGASPADVETLDAGLARLTHVLAEELGDRAIEVAAAPGAGAAGGVGYAAMAVLDAQRRPGIDVVLDVVGLADRIAGADLVITGEGSLDEQSLGGKAPIGVAQVAARASVPVVAVCGRTTLTPQQRAAAGFVRTYALTDLVGDSATAIRDAARLTTRTGQLIGRALTDLTAVRQPGVNDRFDLVIRAERAITPTGVQACELGIRDGVIGAVEPWGAGLDGREVFTLAADEILLPGLVDSHVHVNEPGRTEWEGFASATRAAAAGGVTTIIDMPLNSIPPTVTVEALDIKRAVARDQVYVDVGFWGGAVPGNTAQLRPMHDAGVFGFKCFLLHSGVDEFPQLEVDEMETDMAELAAFDSILIVHAEDACAIDAAPAASGDHYDDFLASRPRAAENIAIAQVIDRARRTGARAHILHLSSSDALPMIAAAKADGVRLTVETCPHYLTLLAEDIPDGATAFKCCPPIREDANREELWRGLIDGVIDFVVSDHSPSTVDLKELGDGDFGEAWGGVSSLQLGLSLMWTEARGRGVSLNRVVAWMSSGPASLVGLRHKGALKVGNDADLAVFAPDDQFVVDPAALHHKNPITPYAGKTLSGVVRRTFLRGRRVDGVEPFGALLRRRDE